MFKHVCKFLVVRPEHSCRGDPKGAVLLTTIHSHMYGKLLALGHEQGLAHVLHDISFTIEHRGGQTSLVVV